MDVAPQERLGDSLQLFFCSVSSAEQDVPVSLCEELRPFKDLFFLNKMLAR